MGLLPSFSTGTSAPCASRGPGQPPLPTRLGRVIRDITHKIEGDAALYLVADPNRRMISAAASTRRYNVEAPSATLLQSRYLAPPPPLATGLSLGRHHRRSVREKSGSRYDKLGTTLVHVVNIA